MYLIFNTYSTDLPRTNVDFAHPLQPHLIQFSALVVDRQGRELDRLLTFVKPGPGAVISPFSDPDAAAMLSQANFHGGNPCDISVWFDRNARLADVIVSHDVALNVRIMATLAARCQGRAFIPKTAQYCTMEHGARFLKMKSETRKALGCRFHSKGPRLTQVHKYLFGGPVAGPDLPLSELEACARIFRYMTGMPSALIE